MTFFKKGEWYGRLTGGDAVLQDNNLKLLLDTGERILCDQDSPSDLYVKHNGSIIRTLYYYNNPDYYYKKLTTTDQLLSYRICPDWIPDSNNTDYEIY